MGNSSRLNGPYTEVVGRVSSTRQHNFVVSKNARNRPLYIEQEKALHVLMKEDAVQSHGAMCLTVPISGQPRTFNLVSEPIKSKGGERQVRSNTEQVTDQGPPCESLLHQEGVLVHCSQHSLWLDEQKTGLQNFEGALRYDSF